MRNLTKYFLLLAMSFMSMNIAMFPAETKQQVSQAELPQSFDITEFDKDRRILLPTKFPYLPCLPYLPYLFFRVPVSIIPETNLAQGTINLGDFSNPLKWSNQITIGITIWFEQCAYELKIWPRHSENIQNNSFTELWSAMKDFITRLSDNTQDMSQLRSEINDISNRLSEYTPEEKKMINKIRPLRSIPEGKVKELRKQYGALMLQNVLDGQKELAMVRQLVKRCDGENNRFEFTFRPSLTQVTIPISSQMCYDPAWILSRL